MPPSRTQPTETDAPQHTSAEPYPTANSNTTGARTRGKRYEYSHTKPPAIAPPPHSTKRPPVPASAAGKKRKTRKTDSEAQESPAIANATTSTNPDHSDSNIPAVTESGSDSSSICPSAVTHAQLQSDNDAGPTDQDDQLGSRFPTLPDIPEEPESDSDQRPSASSEKEAEVIRHDDLEHAERPQKTPGRHPDIQIVQPTPDRTNVQTPRVFGTDGTPRHSGTSTSISAPSPFTNGAAPHWALDFDDDAESILNPTIQFNRTLLIPFPSMSDFNNPSSQFPAFTFQGPNSPAVQRHIANGAPTNTINSASVEGDLPGAGPSIFQSPNSSSLTSRSQAPLFPHQGISMTSDAPPALADNHLSIPELNNFERRSISPAVFGMQTDSNSSSGGADYPASQDTRLQLPTDLASLHSGIVQGLQPSARPIPFVSRSSPAPPATGRSTAMPSRAPTPVAAPVAAALSRSTTPATDHHAPPTNGNPHVQPGKTRDDFSYDEHQFNEQMKPRWQWYLIAENAFPVDLTDAQELCIAYAEEMLGVTRDVIGNVRRGFSYVRAKDSRMRHEFQCAVLANVEHHYGVTGDLSAKKKIQELIKHSNFMYSAYNPSNISIVVGRCRHPCIGTVMLSVLFPSRARGQAPGVRFIRQLIAVAPQDSLWEYEDKEANYGAPVALIALACTLILHALRLLELGYSSKDDSMKKKKLINFDEATYGDYYRKLVKKLKAYPRMGELRRFHMKQLLQEYTNRYTKGAAKDLLVADDDIERFSDAE